MAYDHVCYVILYRAADGDDWYVHAWGDDAGVMLLELRQVQADFPEYAFEMLKADERLLGAQPAPLEGSTNHANQH